MGNITIISPADPGELAKTLFASLNHTNSVYIRLTGGSGLTQIYEDDYNFEIGKGASLKELNDKHSNEMEIVRKESTRLNNIIQEKNDQVAELNGKVTQLNSKLTISESTITNLKYEIEQIKNKKSEANQNDTIQKLTLLKEEHLKAIQNMITITKTEREQGIIYI